MSTMVITANIVRALTYLVALLSVLSQIEFWQRKEYRLDRVRSALFGQELNRELVVYVTSLTLLALVVKNPLAPYLSLIVQLMYYSLRLYRYGIHRPIFTSKAKLATAVTGLLTGIIYLLGSRAMVSEITYAVATLLSIPLAAVGSIFIINLVTNPRKRQIIRQAKELRRRQKNLTVIGITGSYGKTSTKHFLSQLLPTAVVSQEHRNSEFAVAQTMLSQLSSSTNLFITEMGAYTSGEITALAQLTKPTIGVITHISNQHVALFGSQENLTNAKWELIDALPPDGIAVLNADDEQIKTKASSAPQPIIWFSLTKPADVSASNIIYQPKGSSCTITINRVTRQVVVPVIGQGALENILAASAAALAANAEPLDIFEKIKHLKPFPRTMEILQGPNGATIIDDSYSANAQGVINSLKHLKTFSNNDKRILMTPIIELGSAGPSAHQSIGQELAHLNIPTYIYHTQFKKELAKPSLKKNNRHQPQFFTNPRQLQKAATKNITSDTVILITGRIPEVVRQALL